MFEERFIFPGQRADLEVLRIDPSGVWLRNKENEVLIPSSEATGAEQPGTKVNVYIYTNEQALQFGTYKTAIMQLGDIKLLKMITVARSGAFAQWDLPVDLFIPQSEQAFEPKQGKMYLVGLQFSPRTGKIYGTTRLNDLVGFGGDHYRRGDLVEAVIAEHQPDGKRAIVDHKFWAIIEEKNLFGRVMVGERVKMYVERRERELLFLSPHNPMESSIDDAKEKILDYLDNHRGYVRLNDDTPSEEINLRLKMSKKAFKRAIGMLYSAGIITITPRGFKKNTEVKLPTKPYLPKEDVEENDPRSRQTNQAFQKDQIDMRKSHDKPRSDRSYPEKASGDRPKSDRPYSPKSGGDRPRSDRPYPAKSGSDRPYPAKPSGDRPRNDGTYSPKSGGDRPRSDRPYPPKPSSEKPYPAKPSGDRPISDRPYSPKSGGDRPRSDRPYPAKSGSDRPYQAKPSGDRPRSDRPYSPKSGGDRPRSDRPYPPKPSSERPYPAKPSGDRPRSDRPYSPKSGGDRPRSDRPFPAKSGSDRPNPAKPSGDRPRSDRPYSPKSGGDRPRSDRPFPPKPSSERPYPAKPSGDRPRSDRPYSPKSGGDRPRSDRPYPPKPSSERPYPAKPSGDRPRSDRPYSPKSGGDRPRSDGSYPAKSGSDRPYPTKPSGDRPKEERTYPAKPTSDIPRSDRPNQSKIAGERPKAETSGRQVQVRNNESSPDNNKFAEDYNKPRELKSLRGDVSAKPVRKSPEKKTGAPKSSKPKTKSGNDSPAFARKKPKL